MNRKQLAAKDENFPSLPCELSEQEAAGGQLFLLAQKKEETAESVKRQVTTYPTATEENQHIKPGRGMMWLS